MRRSFSPHAHTEASWQGKDAVIIAALKLIPYDTAFIGQRTFQIKLRQAPKGIFVHRFYHVCSPSRFHAELDRVGEGGRLLAHEWDNLSTAFSGRIFDSNATGDYRCSSCFEKVPNKIQQRITLIVASRRLKNAIG